MAYEELIQSLDATVDEGRESLGQAGAFKSMETVAPSALVMDTLPKEPLMLLKYATDTVLQQFSHLQREFMDQKARNDKASQEILELQNVSRELSSFKEQHAMEVDSISHSLRAQAKEESSKLREKIEQLKAEMEESVSKKKELEEQIQLLTMQESDTDESFEALLS